MASNSEFFGLSKINDVLTYIIHRLQSVGDVAPQENPYEVARYSDDVPNCRSFLVNTVDTAIRNVGSTVRREMCKTDLEEGPGFFFFFLLLYFLIFKYLFGFVFALLLSCALYNTCPSFYLLYSQYMCLYP